MATPDRPISRLLSLVAITALATAAFAKPTVRYKVIELGGLGAPLSYANSVNDKGAVVGNVQYADGHLQAFEWDATSGIRRVDPTAKQSVADCINDNGVIAGAIQDGDNLINAVLWPSVGAQPKEIAWAPFGAVATCVNRKNQAVGYLQNGVFQIVDDAFSWPPRDPSSAWNDLFGPFHDSFATAINDRGEVVGSVDRQAFLIDTRGQVHLLAGDPIEGLQATAVAISDRGDVLVSRIGQGCLVTRNATLEISADDPVFPMALNDSDVVVGHEDGTVNAAFIWDQTDGVRLIDDLISTPGWHIVTATSINRSGMIAGYGIKNGRRRAVLLVPVRG